MMVFFLQTVLITIAFTPISTDIEMSGCGENRQLEMLENTQNNVTCTNIGGTDWSVTWNREFVQLGQCDAANSCVSRLPDLAVLSRPIYSTSTLTTQQVTRQLFGNKNVQCATRRPSSLTVERQDNCTIYVVVPAVLSAGSVEVVKTRPIWTLRANTTITTVFSSRGRYSCVWYTDPQSGAAVGSDTSPTLSPDASNTSDLSNRAGWCSSSWTMPLTDGTPSYVVVASPGGTRQSAGSVNIARPASPSLGSGCPGDYVPELSAVTCTCITNSLGSPPGVIGWSHNMSSPVLTLPNVTRSDHNTNFTCNLKWSSLTQNTNWKLRVAYGPDPGSTTISSAIVTNGVFDTDGSRDLQLTCSTQEGAVNPAPSYSWDRPDGCRSQGQESCTFRPQPPQNVTATCTVSNQMNSGRAQTVDITVILNYPPTQSPGITGYSTGHVLYMNDPLSLTCDVTGGYPPVSNVTLKCGNHIQTVTPGQQGKLNISLTANDHQATCNCSATWKVTSLYTRTGSVSLTVHSPPSAPSISRVSPAQFPYMEGDTPTLTCSSSKPGFPTATYTWSGNTSQDNVVTSPNASQLRMAPLTRHDNHRIIVCNATNDYTQHRGDVTPTNHNITVYYLSVLKLTSTVDNNCTFRPDLDLDRRSCVVPEGQPIRVQCSAVSNPEVASITWTSPAGLTNGQGGNGQLVIPSADKHAHNTLFNCTAITENSPPDSRLPLTDYTSLHVYVAYPSSVKALKLNNVETNLTVNESDVTSVSLTCRSDGRPTPRMQLVRKHNGTVLKTVTGDSYTDVDDDTVVDHVISPARCEDTGSYVCVSDNHLGPEERRALSLFVNCVPRRAESGPLDPLKVNYEGRPVQLSVNMVAFPLPDIFTFVFHGPANNMSEPVTTGKLDSRCWNTFPAYRVTCNVIVNDITSRDAGVYSLKIGNSVGHSNILFEVTYFVKDAQAGENSSSGLTVGGAIGVTLALMFVIVGVVVVWMWRRHWILPCASSSAHGSNNTEYNQSAVLPAVSAEHEEQRNANEDDNQQASNQYDSLRRLDIGVRSEYAEFSHYVNAGVNSAKGAGVRLPQCAGTPNAIELKEGVEQQTTTCTGTSSTQQVSWYYDASTNLAICNAPSDCYTSFGSFVTPTRDDSSSTLTFPGAMSRNLLGNSSITCTLAGTPPQTSSCSTDVIYAAEKPTCSISSKRDNSDPKLNGVCTINKAFSSIGRYDCLWFQRHGNAQGTTIPEDKTSVTSPVMIPGTDSKPYYSFNCSFEVTLPLEAGLYNYTVSVQPGSAITSTTYNINSTSQLNVTLNNNTANLTVREGDHVTVTCAANGRPTPSLQLYSHAGQEEKLLNQTNGGDNMLEDRVTSLNYVIISADCRHTATYQCKAGNGLNDGERKEAGLQLYVLCGPRLQEPVNTDPFELNYTGYPVHLSVDMLAFPLPDTFTFEFNGPENNVSEQVTSGHLDSRCWNTFAAYAVTCNVTVNNMTSGDAGFYSMQIGNGVGNSSISFEIKYFELDLQAGESSGGGLSTGAVVGVALALVFVVVGVVVVMMWRRHWVLPCASSSAIGSNNTENNQSAVSPPVSGEREEQHNARSNEMPDNQQATNQYEILRHQDVGVKSDYAELSHGHTAMKSDNGADNNQQATNQYEILRPLDIGMRSDYAELSHRHAGAGPFHGDTQP